MNLSRNDMDKNGEHSRSGGSDRRLADDQGAHDCEPNGELNRAQKVFGESPNTALRAGALPNPTGDYAG
ncbi:MAG: hypothetical protein ABSG80_01930 [Verrucomicrobiota bacterium]|jgi:hypothetical protein